MANRDAGREVIELKRDGNYLYVCQVRGAEEFRNIGRWKFYYQDGAPRITFQNFVVGPGGYGNAKLGFWDIEVDRSWFGSLRLPLDRDLGYYYIKKGG